MFSEWGWDKAKTFADAVQIRLRKLRQCNASLYGDAQALRALPTEELAAYMRGCLHRGQAMSYVGTGLYAPCVPRPVEHARFGRGAARRRLL